MTRIKKTGLTFDPTVPPEFGQPTNLSGIDSTFKLVSDDYCALIQRSREELMNTAWTEIIHADALVDASNKQQIMIATGEPYDVNCSVLRGDGRWIRGHFRASRIDMGPGRPPLIQANAWFEPVPATKLPDLDVDRNKAAFAEYAQAITQELAKMAEQQKMTTLQRLLAMASLEAAEELQKQFPGLENWPLPKRLN